MNYLLCLVFVLGAGFGSAYTAHFLSGAEFSDWLFRWQTLAAGTLAAGIGLGSALLVLIQIQRRQKEITENLERESRTAKAALPQALSSLSKYASSVHSYILGTGSKPQPNEEAISALRNVLRFIESGDADWILKIIVLNQIIEARLENFSKSHFYTIQMQNREKVQRLYDICEFAALIYRAFPFSRNQNNYIETAPLSEEDIKNAHHQCFEPSVTQMNVALEQELFDEIESRTKNI